MKVAILGAMPQEVEAYEKLRGANEYWKQHEVHIGITGVGKTAAAMTTQRVIDVEKPKVLIFSGVAGALDDRLGGDRLKIGDIVVGRWAIDADMDVRRWDKAYQRGEQPFTRDRVYYSDSKLVDLAHAADTKTSDAYIATGSEFLDKGRKLNFIRVIRDDLDAKVFGSSQEKLARSGGRYRKPDVYDMESSAVLQVANANNVPAIVIRAISDSANGDAPKDFDKFIKGAVTSYASIVTRILGNLGRL